MLQTSNMARPGTNTAGNWTVDTLRFPKGLRPVADEIHKVGAKFMVWFEPERVIRGTQWAVEHPDWMLDIPEHNNDTYLLFDLGNPEACHWMSKYIGDMLEENSIDYYRRISICSRISTGQPTMSPDVQE